MATMFDYLQNNQATTGYTNPLGNLGFGDTSYTPQATPTLGQNQFLSGLGGFGGGDSNNFLGSGMSGFQAGQLGIGGLQGLLNGYLGFQNLSLAKKQAGQAQDNWNKQWDANVKSTNTSLRDRQAARVASNPNAYESVDDYMKKYGIS